ncbi:MAG: TRAP transporter small permease [Sagittula sp.]|uniref:TRAP transporter small permease n=1 Tax=Sagittula sp. TaxID=2038081 RepID=UPI0040585AAB
MYRRLMAGLDRAAAVVETAAAVVAGAAALAAMLLVTADALMRHVFSAPLTFQLVLTQDYLLVALLLMAMPWGYRTGGFIRLDLLLNTLPDLARQLVLRAGLLASGIYAARLAWLSWLQFDKSYSRGDVVMGVIDWPVAWSWVWLPIGLGLLALRLLIDAASPDRIKMGASHA